jgi:biotin operon repressor
MKQKMQFTLHGKEFKPQSTYNTLLARCLSMKDGDLMDLAEMCELVCIRRSTIRDHATKLREVGVSVNVDRRNYFGNKKTIAELVRESQVEV